MSILDAAVEPDTEAAPRREAAVTVDRDGPPTLLRRALAQLTPILRGLVLVAMGMLAISPLGSLYADGTPATVLVAVALGAVVAYVVARMGGPSLVSVVAVTVAVIAYVGPIVSDQAIGGVLPGPGVVGDVWRGMTAGWRDLLTVGLPAEAEGDLLAGPLGLGVLVGWGSAELGQRSGIAGLALLPSIAALVASLAVASSRATPSILLPAAFVALCLAYLAMRAGLPDGSDGDLAPLAQWLVFAGPVVVGLAVLGVLAGLFVPLADDGSRFDLRDRVDAPVVVHDAITPLARIASQQEGESAATEFFTVTFDRLPADASVVDFLPVAVLDTFDGAIWTTSATYLRPGSALPAPDPLPGQPVSATVELVALDSQFLPFLPNADAVSGRDLGYDTDSGMLVTDTPNLEGYSYSFTAGVESAETLRDRAVGANPAGGDEVARLLEVPDDLPPRVAATVTRIEEETSTAFTRLDLLHRIVTEGDRGYTPLARAGHSLGRIDRFLGGGDDPVAQNIGTSEQGAAAFVTVARALGFPSRIVVGYRLPELALGEPVSITAGAIEARAEVLLADVGWVPFDVRPVNEVEPPDDQDQAALPGEADPDGELEDLENPTVSDTIPPAVAAGDDGGGSGFPWGLIVFVVLLVGVVAAGPVAKALRRRRRRAGTPAHQVLGAAAELRDRLIERGVPVRWSSTFHDLLQHDDGRIRAPDDDDLPPDPFPPAARDAGDALIPLIDRALYDARGPELPDAVQAWKLEGDFVRGLTEHDSPLVGLKMKLDPRPLLFRPPPRHTADDEFAGAGTGDAIIGDGS